MIAVDIDGKAVPGAKVEVKSGAPRLGVQEGPLQDEGSRPADVRGRREDGRACRASSRRRRAARTSSSRRVIDDKGRANQTKLTYWVSGGENPPAREVAQEQVQLIPDKKEYTPGNTAELMVQAPFYPAEGVVTWRRSGIVKTERITLTGPTASLKVPITDDR